jgi:hypothetical protein
MTVVVAMLVAAQSANAQFPGGGGGGMGGGGMGGGRRGGGMGGGGMGGGRDGGMGRNTRQPDVKFPSAKTLEKYNPASLLLDKHKKLSLADSQQARLTGLRLQIFERNAPLLASYDSLQRDFKPPTFDPRSAEGGQPAVDSTRRAAGRQMFQLRQLVDSLQDRRRADVQEVLRALADDTQRKKAAEFLDKQDIEFSKEFPAPPMQRGDREPGGEGGPGGGGRGGRRPPG